MQSTEVSKWKASAFISSNNYHYHFRSNYLNNFFKYNYLFNVRKIDSLVFSFLHKGKHPSWPPRLVSCRKIRHSIEKIAFHTRRLPLQQKITWVGQLPRALSPTYCYSNVLAYPYTYWHKIKSRSSVRLGRKHSGCLQNQSSFKQFSASQLHKMWVLNSLLFQALGAQRRFYYIWRYRIKRHSCWRFKSHKNKYKGHFGWEHVGRYHNRSKKRFWHTISYFDKRFAMIQTKRETRLRLSPVRTLYKKRIQFIQPYLQNCHVGAMRLLNRWKQFWILGDTNSRQLQVNYLYFPRMGCKSLETRVQSLQFRKSYELNLRQQLCKQNFLRTAFYLDNLQCRKIVVGATGLFLWTRLKEQHIGSKSKRGGRWGVHQYSFATMLCSLYQAWDNLYVSAQRISYESELDMYSLFMYFVDRGGLFINLSVTKWLFSRLFCFFSVYSAAQTHNSRKLLEFTIVSQCQYLSKMGVGAYIKFSTCGLRENGAVYFQRRFALRHLSRARRSYFHFYNSVPSIRKPRAQQLTKRVQLQVVRYFERKMLCRMWQIPGARADTQYAYVCMPQKRLEIDVSNDVEIAAHVLRTLFIKYRRRFLDRTVLTAIQKMTRFICMTGVQGSVLYFLNGTNNKTLHVNKDFSILGARDIIRNYLVYNVQKYLQRLSCRLTRQLWINSVALQSVNGRAQFTYCYFPAVFTHIQRNFALRVTLSKLLSTDRKFLWRGKNKKASVLSLMRCIKRTRYSRLFVVTRKPAKITNTFSTSVCTSYNDVTQTNNNSRLHSWYGSPCLLQYKFFTPRMAQFGRLFAVAYRKYRLEQRFGWNQPKLQLPRTTLTRRRRRKSELGFFVKISFKQPQTKVGLKNFLLLPRIFYNQADCIRQSGYYSKDVQLSVRRYISNYPRTWTQREGQQGQKRIANRKKAYYQRKWAGSGVWAERLRADNVKLHSTQLVSTKFPLKRMSIHQTNQLYPLFGLRQTVFKLQGVYSSKSPALLVRPYPTRMCSQQKAKHVELFRSHTSIRTKKQNNMWHAASIQKMQMYERALSAWSPQYSLQSRQWSFPRRAGTALPRTEISLHERRRAIKVNEWGKRHGILVEKSVNTGYPHLQFRTGSTGSAGYTRCRRVYRTTSLHQRWWKPLKNPVPFVNPYSRRLLNLHKYRVLRPAQLWPQKGNQNTQHNMIFRTLTQPPVYVPWRNFNWPWPWKRKPKPFVLQRWLFKDQAVQSSRTWPTRVPTKRIVFQRGRRELRDLAADFPHLTVWAGRRWEMLDYETLAITKEWHLFKMLPIMPEIITAILCKKVGGMKKLAALQRAVLANFHNWNQKLQVGVRSQIVPELLKPTLQGFCLAAECVLTSKISFALERVHEREDFIYQFMRQSAFVRKMLAKREQFWEQRELRELQIEAIGSVGDTQVRENNLFYRYWLRGAERYLQKLQYNYIPTSHNAYDQNYATNLFRTRVRFPAAGRQRKSYDSLLHVFSKKASPSRFRRVATWKFPRLQVQSTGNLQQNLSVVSSSCVNKRQRTLAAANQTMYLSTAWRQLLNYRVKNSLLCEHMLTRKQLYNGCVETSAYFSNRYAKPLLNRSKRRFASLPINFVYKHRCSWARVFRPQVTWQLHTMRKGLLRTAKISTKNFIPSSSKGYGTDFLKHSKKPGYCG
jgi:hypothetical protein